MLVTQKRSNKITSKPILLYKTTGSCNPSHHHMPLNPDFKSFSTCIKSTSHRLETPISVFHIISSKVRIPSKTQLWNTVILRIEMDEFLFNRNLSRNSSVGCSSRIYYCRSNEGVPFNWEMQPGTPRSLPKEETIPPITPPPAVISLGLPKPRIDVQQSKPPTRPRLRFWRKSNKNKRSKNITIVNNVGGGSDKFDIFDFCSSDSEFMAATSQRNSSSSSSSSFSFSKGRLSRECSSLRSTPARDSFSSSNAGAHMSCSPWNFSSVLINIARRVWCVHYKFMC